MGSDFEEAYVETRALNKPKAPEAPRTRAQIQEQQIAAMTRAIGELEKSKQNLPKDLIPEFQEAEQALIDQKKEYENSDSEMVTLLYDAEIYNHQQAVDQYETQLAAWKDAYPPDHRQMIKARLIQFLKITETVDFNAALRDENGLKKFVNPAYERESKEWKLAFRCGQPVVEAARAFATQWLSELD